MNRAGPFTAVKGTVTVVLNILGSSFSTACRTEVKNDLRFYSDTGFSFTAIILKVSLHLIPRMKFSRSENEFQISVDHLI